MEVESPSNENQDKPQEKPKTSLITEIGGAEDRVSAPEPSYTIMREPPDGHPEFLVIEIKLPGVVSRNFNLKPKVFVKNLSPVFLVILIGRL